MPLGNMASGTIPHGLLGILFVVAFMVTGRAR